jgi:hypothetical protein
MLPLPQIIYLSASLASSIYLMKWAVTQLDPNRPALEAAKRRQKELEQQIGRPLVRLQGLEAVTSQCGAAQAVADISTNGRFVMFL